MCAMRRSRRGVDEEVHTLGEPISRWTVAAAGRERRRSTGGASMRTRRTPSIRLLPLGAGPRLAGATLIIAALWGAFFWATSTPGGL